MVAAAFFVRGAARYLMPPAFRLPAIRSTTVTPSTGQVLDTGGRIGVPSTVTKITSTESDLCPCLASVVTLQREQDLARLVPKRGLVAAQTVKGTGR
jgi:hypothetical protein